MTMLRQHRVANGFTCASLGKRIGASKAAVSSWETGRTTPHPKYMRKLAKAFGLRRLVLVRMLNPDAFEPASAA